MGEQTTMRTVRGSRALYAELRAIERRYPAPEAVVFGLHDGGADTPARQTIITIPDDPELALDVDIQDVVWLETHQYLRRWAFGATWRIELL